MPATNPSLIPIEDDLVVVDADKLDALVAEIAKRFRRDDRRYVRGCDHSIDLILLRSEERVDLLVRGFLLIDVGEMLN